MIEFILKYWLTALFGLIAAGLGALAKHYYNLLKKDKKYAKEKETKNFELMLKRYVDSKFKDTEESHKKLYKAVLDVQSKQFQRDCYTYLKTERDITLEEFDNLYRNYEIYKSLGGNGIGTMLFEKVEEKYTNQLFTEQILDATMMKVQEMNAESNQANMTAAAPTTQIIKFYDPPQRPIQPTQHNQGEPKG